MVPEAWHLWQSPGERRAGSSRGAQGQGRVQHLLAVPCAAPALRSPNLGATAERVGEAGQGAACQGRGQGTACPGHRALPARAAGND